MKNKIQVGTSSEDHRFQQKKKTSKKYLIQTAESLKRIITRM